MLFCSHLYARDLQNRHATTMGVDLKCQKSTKKERTIVGKGKGSGIVKGKQQNTGKGAQKDKRASKKGKALGQAPALPLRMWKEWLKWILNTAGPKIFLVVFLTGAFGLRCGEALALKREDLNVEATIPKLVITGESAGARKSPGDVYIRTQHLKVIKRWLRCGIPNVRRKKHKHGKGKQKTISVKETYVIPKTGFMFPSRKNAARPFLHYHAVYDHVRRQAPKFLAHLQKTQQQWGPEIAKLRPHSGRATLITELMGEGLTTALSMKYARHAPSSYKVHLKYGRLTLQDIKQACDATRGSSPKKTKFPWANMSSKDLLQCQKEILHEITRRNALK